MKIPSILSIAIALTVLLGGCDWDLGIRGNGHIVTAEKPVPMFSEIRGRGALRIDWHSGAPSLKITTDENLIPYLEIRSDGNRLDVRMRERVRPTHGIKIAISSPSLTTAEVSGATDLIAHGVSGPAFAIQSTGAANIVVDGSVERLLADLTGASDLKAKDLQAKTVEISTTGAAHAWVSATEKLRVAATGAADVTYSGNPPTIERHITGAGSIRRKD